MEKLNAYSMPEMADNDNLENDEENLPISNISKIMKKYLDNNMKISKEAKELVEECVTEFICFITSEASDKCKKEKRKTINGEDILTVMKHLGFDNYVVILQVYFYKYRESLAKVQNEVNKNLQKPE
jgi:nuclear transcription Y subunit beta